MDWAACQEPVARRNGRAEVIVCRCVLAAERDIERCEARLIDFAVSNTKIGVPAGTSVKEL